jgi:hypothetical protein
MIYILLFITLDNHKFLKKFLSVCVEVISKSLDGEFGIEILGGLYVYQLLNKYQVALSL